mmetsp:Transcript_80323/g.236283  ORF Transcript_80323/g.236283 Transcript_80323/m.236283 type:complete len:229 (-) Transcript_80323:1059-1745(-)
MHHLRNGQWHADRQGNGVFHFVRLRTRALHQGPRGHRPCHRGDPRFGRGHDLVCAAHRDTCGGHRGVQRAGIWVRRLHRGRWHAGDPGHHARHRRLRPRGGQCRRPGGDGGTGRGGASEDGLAGRAGQHDGGHRQGFRHRQRRADSLVPAVRLPATGGDQHLRLGRPPDPQRPTLRGHAAAALRLADHDLCGEGGGRDHPGGPEAVRRGQERERLHAPQRHREDERRR